MNITTIIELGNQEVEGIIGGKLIFAQEQIDDNIIETCVECIQMEDSEEKITTEDGMQRVFDQLKEKGVIPAHIDDFSFEMPSCERLKNSKKAMDNLPQKIILSYMS